MKRKCAKALDPMSRALQHATAAKLVCELDAAMDGLGVSSDERHAVLDPVIALVLHRARYEEGEDLSVEA